LLYEGKWDTYESHLGGVLIEKDGGLWLNGTKLLYEGNFDSYELHRDGVLLCIDDMIVLVVIKPPEQK
jgi:hypothetical protein